MECLPLRGDFELEPLLQYLRDGMNLAKTNSSRAHWGQALEIFSGAAQYWMMEDEAWVDELRKLYPELDAQSRAGDCKKY